jgi:SagB-type dehydrogenase family enzyme
MKTGWGVMLVSTLLACTLNPPTEGTMSQTKTQSPEIVTLPAPLRQGRMSLEEAIARRRSVREFKPEALTESELSQLLWSAQGITDPAGYRSAPSAGALYPLEVYVATPSGFYHYEVREHHLTRLIERDLRPAICRAALEQEAIRQAPADFVITAVYARIEQKYGAGRGPRYVHLEAGHAAQNLLLQAVALGLGAVPIGAFDDGALQRALALRSDHLPLYVIPVGHAR